jgi:hypothetical protein
MPLRQFEKREPEPTIPDAKDAVASDDASPLLLSYQ